MHPSPMSILMHTPAEPAGDQGCCNAKCESAHQYASAAVGRYIFPSTCGRAMPAVAVVLAACISGQADHHSAAKWIGGLVLSVPGLSRECNCAAHTSAALRCLQITLKCLHWQASAQPSCGASWPRAPVWSSPMSTPPRPRSSRSNWASTPSPCTATSSARCAAVPRHESGRVHALLMVPGLQARAMWPERLRRAAKRDRPSQCICSSHVTAPGPLGDDLIPRRQEASVTKVVDYTVARFGTLNTYVRTWTP